MFITFEGIDSSGKSTQVEKLSDALTKLGKKVLALREPGGTTVAEAIRTILLDKKNLIHYEDELLLFTSARANLVSNVIIPELKIGTVVICDRFADSSITYQSFGRGIKREVVELINNFATQNLKPDLTFVVDISVDTMIERTKIAKKIHDRMEENKIDFYEKVRNGYNVLSKEEPNRVKIIDGTKSIEQIHETIIKFVQQKLN